MNGNIVAELARITVEEVYNEDHYEALEELLAEEEDGFYPTPEMEEEARIFSGYYTDNEALCIYPDTTECGEPIPAWAFN